MDLYNNGFLTEIDVANQPLAFRGEPAVPRDVTASEFAVTVNPGSNFTGSYDDATGLLEAVVITAGTAGSPYGVVKNTTITDVQEVIYSWGLHLKSWFVVGQDASGLVYMAQAAGNTTPSTALFRVNATGSITSVATLSFASGANAIGRVRVVQTDTTVEVYEEHTAGQWRLWTTIDKAATGITTGAVAAVAGSGADTTQSFRVYVDVVAVQNTATGGKTVDVASVPTTTLRPVDAAADSVLLTTPGTSAGVKRMPVGEFGTYLGTRKWAGKKIHLYGDSISSTDYTWYAEQLAAKTGAQVTPGGYSGATVEALTNNTSLNTVAANNPDLVICLVGGNDQGVAGTVGTFVAGSPGGEPTITDPDPALAYAGTTYLAAASYIARYLNSKLYDFRTLGTAPYPRRPKIMFLNGLPQHRDSHDLTTGWNNPANHARKAAAIRELCERYHLPYLDSMTRCGWDVFLEPFWTSPTDKVTNNGVYTMDGLHPNEYGYDRLTDVITEFIQGV